MNFTEAQEQEQKNRKEQMATRYSDEEIRNVIDNADRSCRFEWNLEPQAAAATVLVAQAMLAYNEMIDRRWGK